MGKSARADLFSGATAPDSLPDRLPALFEVFFYEVRQVGFQPLFQLCIDLVGCLLRGYQSRSEAYHNKTWLYDPTVGRPAVARIMNNRNQGDLALFCQGRSPPPDSAQVRPFLSGPFGKYQYPSAFPYVLSSLADQLLEGDSLITTIIRYGGQPLEGPTKKRDKQQFTFDYGALW